VIGLTFSMLVVLAASLLHECIIFKAHWSSGLDGGKSLACWSERRYNKVWAKDSQEAWKHTARFLTFALEVLQKHRVEQAKERQRTSD